MINDDRPQGMLSDLIPGVVPNRAVRPAALFQLSKDPTYDLLAIEFDDQGRPYYNDAIARLMDHLDLSGSAAGVFVCVFVHGWKHNASDSDENVASFHRLLHATAHVENLRKTPAGPRRVVGIYIGWRGLSFHWLNLAQNLTFWDRKEAALRVALGSVREVLARLRRFRLAHPRQPDRAGTTLVMAGHSFGGLILYSSLAEYLIESVAVPPRSIETVMPFCDLTILINPAFEASRYYPLHDIVTRRNYAPDQVPVFLSVTAENDWATKYAFPIGRNLGLWNGPWIDRKEYEANFNTIGHLPWMQTHELTLARNSGASVDTPFYRMRHLGDDQREALVSQEDDAYRGVRADRAAKTEGAQSLSTRVYSSGAALRQISAGPGQKRDNPFWVVKASPSIVDGHNGIFKTVFLEFLRQVIDDTMRSRSPNHQR